jgi:hypothetical protein
MKCPLDWTVLPGAARTRCFREGWLPRMRICALGLYIPACAYLRVGNMCPRVCVFARQESTPPRMRIRALGIGSPLADCRLHFPVCASPFTLSRSRFPACAFVGADGALLRTDLVERILDPFTLPSIVQGRTPKTRPMPLPYRAREHMLARPRKC